MRRNTGYELVLSAVELSPEARDYQVAQLVAGDALVLEIDWINEEAADVGLSRTAQTERVLESLLGSGHAQNVDAVVGEVSRD